MKKTNFFKSSLMVLFFAIGLTSAWGQYSLDFEGTTATQLTTSNYNAPASVTLNGVTFSRSEVLLGNLANDWKNGLNSARFRNRNGSNLTMTQNIPNGIGTISFSYRRYGTDSGQNAYRVEYSINDGSSWTQIGSLITPNNSAVATFSETVNVAGNFRIRIIANTNPGTTGDRRWNLDDLVITSYSATPCDEGTLTGGTTVATPAEVTSGGSTVLSLTGVSTGTGLSYQWQSSADGTNWSDISTATSSTYNATNITANTYYRAKVTCGAITVESTTVLVTLTYCTAGATDATFESISNFTYGTIDNDSSATTGYENFTSISTDIEMGTEIPFSIDLAESYDTDQVLIWIDLNQNLTFDANELLFTSAISNANPVTGTITIPTTATEGSTRLRIRLHDSDGAPANDTPCGNSQFGQVEDYTINILPSSTITWLAGGGWSNGTGPTSTNDDVLIEGDLVTSGNLLANNLTVSSTGSITISGGNSLTLAGQIVNNATAADFVVESGAGLVQTADFTGANEGEITVIRESNTLVRNDNTQWSSPVENQSLRGFSPETLYNRFWTYNEGTNLYQSLFASNADDAVFAKGAGYSIRVRNTLPTGQTTTHLGTFVGVPFNGDVAVNVTTATDGFNIIGNPYASNINVDGADGFLGVNPNVEALYFWTHQYPVGDPSYGDNYDSYTRVGSTNVTNPDLQTISVGQGFLVKATAGTTQVNFNNTMRTADAATFFKNGDDVEKHRIWLSLSTEDNAKLSTTLVGYMTGATNDYDQQIDGKSLSTEFSSIYNVLANGNYAIQGRALPFEDTDVVSLGFKATEAGKYIISLSNFDGLFSEGEVTIYLKDNQLNVTHNLMEGAYTFEAGQGEFNERFQIVYETEEVMGTGDLTAGSVQIYKQGQNIVIDSKTEKILSVELFDLSGRNIHRNDKVNNNTYQIKSNSKGVLVVRVLTQNGEVVTKKVINN